MVGVARRHGILSLIHIFLRYTHLCETECGQQLITRRREKKKLGNSSEEGRGGEDDEWKGWKEEGSLKLGGERNETQTGRVGIHITNRWRVG